MSSPQLFPIPLTERRSPRSENFSNVSVKEMLEIVVDSHREIFSKNDETLTLENTLSKLREFSVNAAEFLRSGLKAAVVLGGCGTSGRMAFLTSFNHAVYFPKSTNFDVIYCHAGGDRQLFQSMEVVEDDVEMGRLDLAKVTADYDRVVYIGISVGLWAPYVASQLNYSLDNSDKFLPVVIGFNPPDLASAVLVKNFGDKTFRSIVAEMKELGHLVLTPIIMPEVLAGSSRMKGGLATLIILDFMLLLLNAKLSSNDYNEPDVMNILLSFARILELPTLVGDDFANMLIAVTEKMRQGRNLCLIGEGDLGILAGFDRSEAEPTFNAAKDEVVAKIHYNQLGSLAYWVKNRMLLSKYVTVKQLDLLTSFKSLATTESVNRFQNMITVNLVSSQNGFTLTLDSSRQVQFAVEPKELEDFHHLKPLYIQILAKLVLHTLSTIVFCQLGKVFKNIMIDVKTSNIKLVHRAIRIVSEIANCSNQQAREAIIQVVTDSKRCKGMSDEEIVAASSSKAQIVPCAIVMILANCSVKEAFEKIKSKRRICEVVQEMLKAE